MVQPMTLLGVMSLRVPFGFFRVLARSFWRGKLMVGSVFSSKTIKGGLCVGLCVIVVTFL